MKKQSFILIVLICCLLIPQTSQAVFSKQLIKNSNFSDPDNFQEDWNCRIGDYIYSWHCDESSTFDQNIAANKYSTLGNYWPEYPYNHHRIYQAVTLPKNTAKAKLSFDYQWHRGEKNDPEEDYFYAALIIPERHDQALKVVRISDTKKSIKEWTKKSYDLSDYTGQQITIYFGVDNLDSKISQAYIDNVKLRAYSTSEYTGTVKNSEGKIVKNAAVKIKNKQGKILWQGKTNNKGKFTATDLKGSSIKRRFYISKNGQTQKFVRQVKWGKAYNKEFILQ